MLDRYDILGLFGNTLTADHMRETSATCSSAIISKTKNIFWNFYGICASYKKILQFAKKDQLHTLNISVVIDSEKSGYMNARKLLFSNTLAESMSSRVLNNAEISMAPILS